MKNLNLFLQFNSTFFKSKLSLILLFLLLLIGDTLTKLFINELEYNFLWIFKAIISFLLMISLLSSSLNLFFKLVCFYAFIIICLLVSKQNDFFFKTSLYFEYVSGILFLSFLKFNCNKKLLNKILLVIFIFYIISTISFTFLDLQFFKTYNANRFGFMPIFSSQNEFSFIMISILIYFYIKYIKNKIHYNLALFILSLICGFLIGTKVVYIFILLFLFFLLYRYLKMKYIFAICFIIISGIFIFKDTLYLFLESNFSSLTRVYSEKGFFNALSSLRISFLYDRLYCQLSNFDFINYFFGGLIKKCLIEMSFFDILLFFGFIGSIFYVFLLKKVIYDSLKLDFFGTFTICITVTLSFVAGYFFENLSSQVYFISVFFVNYYEDS